MGFLTPFMLWGALAAGIPVAIHLFFRSRYRTVPWAAMKFLLTSVEQTSRRLKFQELLLLLLRIAVLLMLALAFARPISSVLKGAGRGEAVDAVFVFDLSYSMGANDGAKSRMERAQEEAVKIIDELPPHSTVQIITCAGKTQNLIGPRSPGNLDQAKQLVKDIELTHLATNLSTGVGEAQKVLERGQASNRELYVFSDMQGQGFDQEADKLKATLLQVKERTLVHMVRCGTRTLKNATIESIVPQAGVPRPGERVDFAIVVRNTGSEAMNNIRISLTVDEDEKKLKGAKADEKEIESTIIPKLAGGVSQAVTLSAKLTKPGLSVLTARIDHDDVPGDNRVDQVILVRDQVNILVVDGSPSQPGEDAEKASSFALMHALMPVKDTDRSTYKYNPRSRPSSIVSAADLKDADICILVNCALKPKSRMRGTALKTDFIEALDPFVREGHGLIIFSGDNVQPVDYNEILDKKYGLLPARLKPTIKPPDVVPFFINRDTFAKGPASYWRFSEDKYFESFDAVPVWQLFDMDEPVAVKKPAKTEKEDDAAVKKTPADDQTNPMQVIVRLNNGKPLAVTKRADKGEVVFFATATQPEGADPKTRSPNWTILNKLPHLVYFLDVTLAHLMKGQTQTYNVMAGDALNWYAADKLDHTYEMVHPDHSVTRLGVPVKIERKDSDDLAEDVKKKRDALKLDRYFLTATDLNRAGVHRITALAPGTEGVETTDSDLLVKKGIPIAVLPDPSETEDLGTLSVKDINKRLEFEPIHIVAGEESVSTGEDRLNREWTVWALLVLLLLVLFEVAFAWWCGRAW